MFRLNSYRCLFYNTFNFFLVYNFLIIKKSNKGNYDNKKI